MSLPFAPKDRGVTLNTPNKRLTVDLLGAHTRPWKGESLSIVGSDRRNPGGNASMSSAHSGRVHMIG